MGVTSVTAVFQWRREHLSLTHLKACIPPFITCVRQSCGYLRGAFQQSHFTHTKLIRLKRMT